MPLTDQDKMQIRRHLGYPLVASQAAVAFGVPRPLSTSFILEQNMNQLMEIAVGAVRSYIAQLNCIEEKLVGAQNYLVAEKLEDLTLRDNHPQLLEEEFNRWAKRLADALGVPLYPYSERFKAGQGDGRASGGEIKMMRRS
jgi:hypothetical protein